MPNFMSSLAKKMTREDLLDINKCDRTILLQYFFTSEYVCSIPL